MQNQINLSPISQFIQQLRAAELNQQKEVKLPIHQARLLSLALSECMDKLNQDYESLYNVLKNSSNTETITVELDGGGFSNDK
jgi:hypothetical protein